MTYINRKHSPCLSPYHWPPSSPPSTPTRSHSWACVPPKTHHHQLLPHRSVGVYKHQSKVPRLRRHFQIFVRCKLQSHPLLPHQEVRQLLPPPRNRKHRPFALVVPLLTFLFRPPVTFLLSLPMASFTTTTSLFFIPLNFFRFLSLLKKKIIK